MNFNANNYFNTIKDASTQWQLLLSDDQIHQLLNYVELLQKWNKHYNLSAIRDVPHSITHHILDSLSVAPYLTQQAQILDVGTGAGLPGMVLAICFPEKAVSLLDSNGKKTRFLTQAKHDLKISNVTIIQSRAENYRTGTRFNAIISRAVGSMSDLINSTQHLLSTDGFWCVMKGVYPESELLELILPYQVHQLSVPGLDGSRHLVTIRNA